MKPLTRPASLALVAAGLLVIGGCANSEPGTTNPGSAGNNSTGTAGNGSTGTAGTGSQGTAGTTGNGGSSATGTAGNGATGSAGSSATGTAGNGATGTAGNGATGSAGSSATGTAGNGATGTAGSGATGTAGRGGMTGNAGRGGATGTAGTGGAAGARGGTTGTAGRGGTTGTAGTTGAGGSTSPTGTGGAITTTTALDCGPNGYVVENHGPPANRVNYIILGDGFSAADGAAGGVFEKDIANSMLRRFSQNAFPYNRYRNFVNICGIKLVSTPICGSSTLGCCGDDSSRLANCNMSAVNSAYNALPKTLTIDWRAVMLNGSSWWNSGGTTMLYSGGNSDAPGAALHEGGHGFHQLADEYGTCTGAGCGMNTNSTGSTGTVYQEVNSCGNPTTTDGKWDMWIGYNATGATGIQSTFVSSRYVATGQYRPSDNSMMNSLFCGRDQANCTANTAYNQVSREQMVMSIWKRIHPIDSTEPTAGAVSSPGVLKVNVIDPAVISVDWTVDSNPPMVNGGVTFDTSTLAAGSHTIKATAYDNVGMDLVRYRSSTCPSSVTGSYCHRTAWKNSTQTVMWTFTK